MPMRRPRNATRPVGGIIAVNRAMDVAAAEAMKDIFRSGNAPETTGCAGNFGRKKNLRAETGGMPDPAASGLMTKLLSGGFPLQDAIRPCRQQRS